jgi:hypothetical protein
MPQLKSIFFTAILPAAAGVWCGVLFTAHSDDGSPALPASSISITSSGDRHQKRPVATVALPPSFSPEPAQSPECVRERIKNLADNRRVEDLRAELEHLPPGEDRNFAIGLLGQHWFSLDHDATTTWIAGLKEGVEKQIAYGGMVNSWTQEDSESASAWVATLPEGAMKAEVGNSLAIALMYRDPAAALSWTLASRHSQSAHSNLATMARGLARHDYAQTQRLLAASVLPEDEIRQLSNTAKKEWNQLKAARGEWDEMLTLEDTPP